MLKVVKKLVAIFLTLFIFAGQGYTVFPAFAVQAPANFRAELLSNSTVRLIWQPLEGATGYKLYQSANGSTYSQLVQLSASDSQYTVENLTPYTTYWFRLTALEDTAESEPVTVRVDTDNDIPSDPANLEVVGSPAATSVTLRWTASTDGSGVVSYKVFIKHPGNSDYSQAGATSQTQYTVTGLLPRTQYFFYVKAVDNAGHESGPSNTVIVDTAVDTTPPSAPGGLTATPVGSNQIRVSWTASTDNVGVAGYEVYRSTGSNGPFSLIGSTGGSVCSYLDTGITANVTYYYKVRAYDAAGNSAFSGVVANQADTQKPTAPQVWALATSSSQVKVTWSGASDNKGVVSYEIYRALGSGSFSKIATDDSSPYYDSSVAAGKTYKYYVRARDAAGNLSDAGNTVSVTTNGDTQKPSVPQNLQLTLVGNTEVRLTWSTSTDNVGVSGYKIYRALGSDDFAWVATTSGTSYNNTGLTADKTYKYYVRAYDAAGNESDVSDTKTIYTSTTPRTDEETVSTSSSAVLEIEDLIKLEVPRGAYNKTVTYKLTARSFAGYSTSGFKTFGQPVEITAKAGTTNVTSFDEDLTITFYYSSSELGSTDTNDLSIYYWDDAADKWVAVPSTVSASARKVTAKVNHLTVFALLADTASVKVPTLSNSGTSTKRIINLYGKTEKNYRVFIWLNGVSYLVTADANGNFTKEVMLLSGRNEIKLKAENSAGKQSSWSQVYVINCSPALVLRDISGHWAEYNIQKALENGVTGGYEDNTFRPGKSVTRAEFCKFVIAAMGLSPVQNPELTFSDRRKIPEWARGYIARAVNEGIISGYDDNTFRADREISRQEMASMLIRALKLQAEARARQNYSLNFQDVGQIQSWAKGAVVLAVEKGLISGYADNSFGPARKATRAEAITMIVKFMDIR